VSHMIFMVRVMFGMCRFMILLLMTTLFRAMCNKPRAVLVTRVCIHPLGVIVYMILLHLFVRDRSDGTSFGTQQEK
jgi:hypothetical protein